MSVKHDCPNKRVRTKRTAELNEAERERKKYRWTKKREWILKRDNSHCQRCLVVHGLIETKRLEVHHIKPAINNMELFYDDSNLITVCRTCNMQLGTKGVLDFEWEPPEYEPVL